MKEIGNIIDKGIDKDYLLSLKERLDNKTKQYDRYKWFFGPIAVAQAYSIRRIREKFEKENSRKDFFVGGANDIISSDKKSFKVLNTYYLGTDEFLQPVLVDNINQHISLFGGSGSGKSVWLFNLLNQTLRKGGGAAFLDGKADLNMFYDFIRLAAENDRLDDILVLNFNQEDDTKITNTFSVFKFLPLNDIKKITQSLTVGKATDFFGKQSSSVLDVVFLILEYMSYRKKEISFQTYMQALDLKALVVNLVPASEDNPLEPNHDMLVYNGLEEFSDFWVPRDFIHEGQLVYKEITSIVNKYGAQLWTDKESAEANNFAYVPDEQLTTQIGGYAGMTLAGIKTITSRFSNIFDSPKNDIDFEKAIYQNKFVYVLIPAMNLDSTGPHALGAFVLEALKVAASKSMGKDTVVGTGDKFKEFSKIQVTANPVFPLVLDELAAFFEMSMNSLGLFIAQARSINVSTILSTQDAASIAGPEGGKAFLDKFFASTLTSVFLKTQDAQTIPYAETIVMKRKGEINEKGEEISNDEDIIEYIKTVKNGFGVCLNERFGKVLTPFVEPEIPLGDIKYKPES